MASLSTSTPIVHRDSTSILKMQFDVSNVHADAKKQSTIEMICEAINVVGTGRKGASYIAIKKYVLSKHGDPESGRLKTIIKKKVLQSVEEGLLLRPTSSKNAKGATGYFVLAKILPKKAKTTAAKDSKKSKIPEQVPDSEATTQKSKVKKQRNLANSALLAIKVKSGKPKISEIVAKNVKKNKLDKTAPLKKAKDVPAKKDAAKKPKGVKKDEVVPTKVDAAKKPKGKETAKDKPPESAVVKKKPKGVKSSKKPVNENKNIPKGKSQKAIYRHDASDSEMMVKKPSKKSTKSYSSDTEIDINSKTKLFSKKAGTKATSSQESRLNMSPPKPLKGRKLYKGEQIQTGNETTTKVVRGRIKKEI